jgi:hypothetical protein
MNIDSYKLIINDYELMLSYIKWMWMYGATKSGLLAAPCKRLACLCFYESTGYSPMQKISLLMFLREYTKKFVRTVDVYSGFRSVFVVWDHRGR